MLDPDFNQFSGKSVKKLDGQRFKIAYLGLFLVGIFLVAVGIGLFFFKNQNSASSAAIQIISASQGEALQGAGQGREVVVHVDGAVNKPGIYHLESGVRVNDAVVAAGGLTKDADRAKINLAAKVSDGQKIYVQRVGESMSPADAKAMAGTRSVSGSVGQIAGESVSLLININTASEAQLDKLPGIGPVTAAKIIASRPYSSLEDLLSKKAVSNSVYQKIKDLITL